MSQSEECYSMESLNNNKATKLGCKSLNRTLSSFQIVWRNLMQLLQRYWTQEAEWEEGGDWT